MEEAPELQLAVPVSLGSQRSCPRGAAEHRWDPSGAGPRKSRTPERLDLKRSKRKVGKIKGGRKGNNPRQAVPKTNVSPYFFVWLLWGRACPAAQRPVPAHKHASPLASRPR